MAVGLDEILASFDHTQQFFRAHLNGIAEEQWDWKPFPACRSIREILWHWADLFSPGGNSAALGIRTRRTRCCCRAEVNERVRGAVCRRISSAVRRRGNGYPIF